MNVNLTTFICPFCRTSGSPNFLEAYELCVCVFEKPVCHSWPDSTMYWTLFHKRHGFRCELLIINVCYNFVYNFVENILQSKRRQRDIFTNLKMFSYKVFVDLLRFDLTRNAATYFNVCFNLKFIQNPSTGNQVVASGRTEGRTDRLTYSMKLIFAIYLLLVSLSGCKFEQRCVHWLF
jgi:hypothetical protein